MQQPGMWALWRAMGQTGVLSQQQLSWQLDVVLAQRAEVSSYTGLHFTDRVCLCVPGPAAALAVEA